MSLANITTRTLTTSDTQDSAAASMLTRSSTQQSNSAPSNYYSSNMNNNNSNTTMTTTVQDDPYSMIDSALQAALRDPRERMALLRLEQVLTEFIRSPAAWIEVGGPYNSRVCWPSPQLSAQPQSALSLDDPAGLSAGRPTTFQRCILHRLADRFGISREPSLQFPDAMRLIKHPQSAIPVPLLQDIALDAPTSGSSSSSSSMTTAEKQPQKTLQIMKRKPNHHHHHKKPSQNGGKGDNVRRSFVDKEKAYAEARARIFQEDNVSAEDNNSNNSTTNNNNNSVTTNNDISFNGNNNNNNTTTDTTEATSERHSLSRQGSRTSNTDTDQNSNSLANGNTSSSNNNNNSNTKAVYRNYWQEAADPDFQRGSPRRLVATAPAFVPRYFNNNANSASAMMAPTTMSHASSGGHGNYYKST